MITGITFAKYFQTVLRILRTYSEDTTLELIDFMSSDEAVLKMEQILSTNPSESELLEILDTLQANEPK